MASRASDGNKISILTKKTAFLRTSCIEHLLGRVHCIWIKNKTGTGTGRDSSEHGKTLRSSRSKDGSKFRRMTWIDSWNRTKRLMLSAQLNLNDEISNEL